MPIFGVYDSRMIRTLKMFNQTWPVSWSRTATFVLAAFLAAGTIELGGRHMAGAVICFVLAVAYLPLRALRRRLTARQGR